MDKLTSSYTDEGGNLVCNNENNPTKGDSNEVIEETQMNNQNAIFNDETINVPEVQINKINPPTVPKTDETIATLIKENNSENSSNNQGSIQQLSLVEDQGRQSKCNKNEDICITPSTRCIQKAPLSESFSNLLNYTSSSDDSEADSVQLVYQSDSEYELEEQENVKKASDKAKGNEKKKIVKRLDEYRENNNSASDDSSSDSSNSSSDESSDKGAKSKTVVKVPKKINAADGEMGLDELPPVPDLSKLDINIKAEDCIQMGNITSIVDRLVTIQSLPNMPAYDFDTLLFLDQGKRPLGHVYDVLGQVTAPMYVVRFNSKEEIESKGIAKGLPVFSAPNTQHTQYVFLQQLMKIKGSDASWKGDLEVPQEFLDFSDDDAEYAFSKQSLNEQDVFDNKRKRNSIEKHKMFEVAMNLKNKVDTARHKMRNVTYEPPPKRYVPQTTHSAFYYHPSPNINQMRQQPQHQQQCSTSYPRFPPPTFAPPPPTFGNFVNVPMFGVNPFGHMMPAFAPNPQSFPPPHFGPPIPPMPPHVLPRPQPPPTVFAPNITVLPPPPPPPTTLSMVVPKQLVTNIPKSPKSPPKPPQHGGVVPKAQSNGTKSRKQYSPQAASDYQQPYPPNLGLPKAPFVPSVHHPLPINIPANMPPPFGPPMPPWPYNLPRNPVNVGNFRPVHHRNGRQYKKQ